MAESDPVKARRHSSEGCKFCGEDIRTSRDDRTQCKLNSLSEDLCVVAAALERIADAAAMGTPPMQSEDLCVVAGAGQRIADAAARIHQYANQNSATAMPDTVMLPRGKAARKIVDSLHIRTMVAAYNHHIVIYSKNRKKVGQLIPGKVWKVVYAHYKTVFPTSPFQEETLKDRLRETLKEMKARGKLKIESAAAAEVATLQSEEELVRSKPTDEPATTRNVLKRSHSLMDGTIAPVASTSSASSTDASDADPPALGPTSPPVSSNEKLKSEVQTAQPQASSLALMEKQFQESASAKQNALLDAKLDRQNIANLKSARDVGVITEEEFKQRVRKILKL
ncbi:unnamed protein product [Calypogeia fissa]